MRHTIETSTAQLTEIQAAFDAANNSRRTDRYAIDAQLTTALAERADLETQLQVCLVYDSLHLLMKNVVHNRQNVQPFVLSA